MPTRTILASGSPRRRELLTEMGIAFTVIKPDIEEKRRPGEPPLNYVARLSIEKASAAAERVKASDDSADLLIVAADTTVILAADTTVILAADTLGIQGGDILEKPATPDEARAMLIRLRDRPHTVATALTALQLNGMDSARITRVTQSIVYMRSYSDADIDAYIATREPFDKAGGYAIQDTTGFNPVSRYEGSYTNIVGMPVETLRAMLDSLTRLFQP